MLTHNHISRREKEVLKLTADEYTSLYREALEFDGWTITGDMLDCSSIGCTPAQIVYIGPNQGTWNNANNWNPARIPTSCDNVTIGMNKSVTLTANAACHELQILLGSSFDTGNFELLSTAGSNQ